MKTLILTFTILLSTLVPASAQNFNYDALGLYKSDFFSPAISQSPWLIDMAQRAGFSMGHGGEDFGPYLEFNWDGNPSTVEITELRPSTGGLGLEMRVSRVTSVSPVTVCLGQWIVPETHIATVAQPSEWLMRWRVTSINGRHMLQYRTPNTFGLVAVPLSCQ